MKAMVLAAGLGERMQPLTRGTPKPALPVLGKPMLSQILAGLARAGILEVGVNVHHLPDRIAELVGDGRDLGLERVFLSPERELLGTGGGLRRAAPFLRGAGPIVVRNADFLADLDFGALVASHRTHGLPVTLALAPARPGYTPVIVDRAGRVAAFGEADVDAPARIAGRYLFTGAHVIDEAVLDLLPDGRSDLVPVLYRRLAAEGRVAAHLVEGFWWEFGTPRSFLDGTLALVVLDDARRRTVAGADPVFTLGSGRVAIGDGAEIAPGVAFRGPCAVGARARVGRSAVLEEVVVLPGADLGEGVILRRCLIGPGASVPAGAQYRNAALAPDDGGTATPASPRIERRDGLLVRSLDDGGAGG